MTIHEFGPADGEVILLFHPSCVHWDVFSRVIPQLAGRFHVIVPAFLGYDPSQPETDFTSVEAMTAEMENWLLARGISHVRCVYGQSMGGSFVLRAVANGRISFDAAIMDGGITPYELPWIVCRLIWLRDVGGVSLAKRLGAKVLSFMFDPEKYAAEDLRYITGCLASMSGATIRNTFWSCDNFSMPILPAAPSGRLYYWYGSGEERDRSWDIRYVRKVYPQTVFEEMPGLDHAEFLALHPKECAEKIVAESEP